MIDYREILERDLGRMGPAPFEFDDVVRRRERRQRNRRIAAGAVALGLALLMIGGWLGAVTFDRSTPADDDEIPRIDLPSAPDDWTRVRFPGAGLSSITAGGPGLVAVGYESVERPQPAIWTSSDGRTWDRVQQEFSNFFSGVSTGGPGLVAVGFRGGEQAPVWTSADGKTWTQAPWDPVFEGAELQAVVAGGPGLVAVGKNREGLQAWYSADGMKWELASVPAPPAVVERSSGRPINSMAVAVSDGRLVAVGQFEYRVRRNTFRLEPVVWTSQDGISWTAVDAPRSQAGWIEWVASGPGGFVGAGTYSVRTSENGESWRPATGRALRFDLPVENYYPRMSDVAGGTAGFVAVGYDYSCDLRPIEEGRFVDASCRLPQAVVWTSPDGVSWTRVPPDPRFLSWSDFDAAASSVDVWGSRFVIAGGGSTGDRTLWISDPPASGSS